MGETGALLDSAGDDGQDKNHGANQTQSRPDHAAPLHGCVLRRCEPGHEGHGEARGQGHEANDEQRAAYSPRSHLPGSHTRQLSRPFMHKGTSSFKETKQAIVLVIQVGR